MTLTFYDIISIITAFQFLLVAIFLTTHKKGNRLSNIIFAAFLFSKAFCIIDHLIFRLHIEYPNVYFIGDSFSFLLGPSIYFYTASLAYKNFKFKKTDLIHLIPFVAFNVFMTFKYHIHSINAKRELLTANYGYVLNYYEALIIYGILDLLIISYIIASLNILRIYRAEIKKAFSSVSHINLSWLNFVLFGFALIYVHGFFNFIILMTTGTSITALHFLSLALMFIFANIIVYKGLKQPEIFSGIESKLKYGKSTISKSDSESYLKKLSFYMKKEKPYLIPSLTINELADKLSIPSRHLSQVINESLNQNFFDFVNSYRIEEAKHILLDNSDGKRTILQIVFETGFNSKSVFNSAFKKHTGMTPSEMKQVNSI